MCLEVNNKRTKAKEEAVKPNPYLLCFIQWKMSTNLFIRHNEIAVFESSFVTLGKAVVSCFHFRLQLQTGAEGGIQNMVCSEKEKAVNSLQGWCSQEPLNCLRLSPFSKMLLIEKIELYFMEGVRRNVLRSISHTTTNQMGSFYLQ